jgi:hypothetical protein
MELNLETIIGLTIIGTLALNLTIVFKNMTINMAIAFFGKVEQNQTTIIHPVYVSANEPAERIVQERSLTDLIPQHQRPLLEKEEPQHPEESE